MTRARVRLDRAGVRQVLASYSGVRRMVSAAADQVGAVVRAQAHQADSPGQDSGVDISGDVIVETASGYDGRPVGVVTIRHPAGAAMQAKYGVLTRAVGVLGRGADWRPH